jgi:acetyltransferase-like isoleucine patch superfamily enzyme
MKSLFIDLPIVFNNIVYYFLKIFYTHINGVNPFSIIVTVFIPQKIFRINGLIPWPVDFRSKVLYYQRVKLGNRSFPGWSPGCYIQGRNGIRIGHNVRIGPGVGLISANHDINDYDRWPPSPPINIGDNVWIGMNTVILPGVTIGNNVAVGANSVVTRDIPSNSIAAGNPCSVIKSKPAYRGKDYSR